MMVGIAQSIWDLQETDKEQFKQRVLSYLTTGYEGWHLLRLEYPFAICEDRRTSNKPRR